MQYEKPSPTILLTGSAGYVGGRLLPLLIERGGQIRCMTRRPSDSRDKLPQEVEIVKGNAFDPESLNAALDGIETAYYPAVSRSR